MFDCEVWGSKHKFDTGPDLKPLFQFVSLIQKTYVQPKIIQIKALFNPSLHDWGYSPMSVPSGRGQTETLWGFQLTQVNPIDRFFTRYLL